MVKEIVTWCSPCYEKGLHEPGQTHYPFVVPGIKKPQALDLCDSHLKELTEPLRLVLEAYGAEAGDAPARPVAGKVSPSKSPSGGPFFCQVPGCGGYKADKGYRTPTLLKTHASSAHGLRAGEYERLYGPAVQHTTPPAGSAPAPDPGLFSAGEEGKVYACDQEGCDVSYSAPQNSRPAQALGMHKSLKHGIKGTRDQERQQRRKAS